MPQRIASLVLNVSAKGSKERTCFGTGKTANKATKEHTEQQSKRGNSRSLVLKTMNK